MALHKGIELNTGVIASYHKVSFVDIGRAWCNVESFIDTTARKNGKEPVVMNTYQMPTDTFSEEAQKQAGISIKVLAYNALKESETFTGAEDI